jgi:transketolase
MSNSELDRLCINTIRFLAVDGVQKANSGHPGMPMGAAAMAYTLWNRVLKHNPADPHWFDRDRFVLSAGHGSMLLYSLLHLSGYDLPLEQLQQFRQWGSLTPGHPEYGLTPGVETTAGPLGQGFGAGVGMAIAQAHLAARYNRPGHTLINHTIYAIVSDGDLMEGISHEAASIAGHLRLGKLIYLYDDNHITIEGKTDLAFSEDVAQRFASYNWSVLRVEDGNDPEAIEAALYAAQADNRPSLIMVHTHIGYGSPGKQDSPKAHGEPLGADEVRATKQNLAWPLEPAFHIPLEVLAHMRKAVERGQAQQAKWQAQFDAYAAEYPDLAAELTRVIKGELPQGWEAALPAFAPDPKGVATRVASGKVINAVAPRVPELIGGSADLAPSTKTLIESSGHFAAGRYEERNFHFGIREHGMGAILNGIALHGGAIPYGATFLVFADYMRPAIRMAALMELPVIYVFTHDSIGVGEDGPTHQPVEQLASLRVIPHLVVLRPADANETAAAWQVAISHRRGPVALVLTRQNLPILANVSPAGVARGAYSLDGDPSPELILIASGSEVHLALEARQVLARDSIRSRVVSMPSWELFELQPQDYRDQVLPPGVTARLAIEVGVPHGWHRYVGSGGDVLAVEGRFGASAPYKRVMQEYGFSVDNVVARAKALLR